MYDDRMYNHMPLDKMPVAMAYVPWQNWSETYDLNKGFKIGTIFPCLNKPFCEPTLIRGGGR